MSPRAYAPPVGGFYVGPKVTAYKCGSCAAILLSAMRAWIHDFVEHRS